MKWYIYKKEKKKKSNSWKRVFLWKPTKISDDCIAWLEFYERQKNPTHWSELINNRLLFSRIRYNYREIED